LQFRYRGSRRESAVAQLFSLGSKASPEIFRSDFAAEFFGGSVFGSEAAGEPVPVDSSPESFGLS